MFRPRNLKCSILLLSIKICINTAININWFLPRRKKQIVKKHMKYDLSLIIIKISYV